MLLVYTYTYIVNVMQCNATLRYVLLCYVSINNYIYTYISVSCCLFPEHLTTSLLLYFLFFVGFYFSSLCWVAMSLRSGIRIPDIDHVLLEQWWRHMWWFPKMDPQSSPWVSILKWSNLGWFGGNPQWLRKPPCCFQFELISRDLPAGQSLEITTA